MGLMEAIMKITRLSCMNTTIPANPNWWGKLSAWTFCLFTKLSSIGSSRLTLYLLPRVWKLQTCRAESEETSLARQTIWEEIESFEELWNSQSCLWPRHSLFSEKVRAVHRQNLKTILPGRGSSYLISTFSGMDHQSKQVSTSMLETTHYRWIGSNALIFKYRSLFLSIYYFLFDTF